MEAKRKTAVITGAARGIGRATAVALAKDGADIYGIDILDKQSDIVEFEKSTEADVEETRKLVEQADGKFYFSQGDIRSAEQLAKIAEDVKQKFGTVDIIVANAAVQLFSPFIDSTAEHWDLTLDTNLKGTVHSLQAFLPMMVPQNKGKVVIISSTQGMRGLRWGSAYSASKWGLIGLTKSLALELGENHINVNAVVPGLINTKLTRNQRRWQMAMGEGYENKHVTEEEVKEKLSKDDALGIPWLEAEDVAPVVAFLCSPKAGKITGAVYDVAAGTSAIYTS